MQYQTSTPIEKSPLLRALPQDLQPGIGFDDLFIGQSEGHVLDLWGEPEQRERVDESFYLIYKSRALEIELQEGQVYRLFFFARKGRNRGMPVAVNGVSFSATKRQVTKSFGPPEDRGPGRVLSNRKYLRAWFLYPQGVQFEFGKSGKVELITIFRPGTDTSK